MTKSSEKKIIEVPYIDQSISYPTGCESVSAVMLLQYLGYPISVDVFIQYYLKKKQFETRDGELYGADPNQYFCGSPYDPDSFGCYAPVICSSLNHIFRTDAFELISSNLSDYEAVNETGTEISDLLRNYIDHDMPVVFWACINMREPIVGPSWRLFDTEELFTWISNEHCMLLVGYDDENYYFNDPYENHGCIGYSRALVEERHAAQYSMAVGVQKKR